MFNILSVEDCLDFMSGSSGQESQETIKIRDLLNGMCSKNVLEKHEKLVMVLNHHSTVEHALVMHRLYAQNCSQQTDEKSYPSMIPKFVRISAFIVEKYLTLKN